MRRSLFSLALAMVLILSLAPAIGAQTDITSFTYQGQLKNNGVGVDAAQARFIFKLWDRNLLGNQIGSDLVIYPVAVVDGIFTTILDFGPGAFDGGYRYLEIGVDVAGGTHYEWLSPRQPLTPAPYALHAFHGGDSPWELSGTALFYDAGKVGVGTDTPAYQLDVVSSGTELRAISGVTNAASGAAAGVYGSSASPDGIGVRGVASATTGTPVGVKGEASGSTSGYGVYGFSANPSGSVQGVRGQVRSSAA